jgi:hypothetical protein
MPHACRSTRNTRRRDACYAEYVSMQCRVHLDAKERILTSEVAGIAPVVATILAQSPWWAELLLVVAILLAALIGLHMLRTGAFKCSWRLGRMKLEVSFKPVAPEREPPRPRPPGRRKPPST